MGVESIAVVETDLYRWIAFVVVAIIGGFASSLINNRGMVKMYRWEKLDKKNFDLGFIGDIIIGLAAAAGILWMLTPQTYFQFLGIGAIGGYGGSSILRGLLNKLEADANLNKTSEEVLSTSSKADKRIEEIKDQLDSKTQELEKAKTLISDNYPKIFNELYEKRIFR